MTEYVGNKAITGSGESFSHIDGQPAQGSLVCFFIPTKDFEDRDTGSQYLRGHRYNLLYRNYQLRQKVDKWQLEKKVIIL